MKTMQGLLGVVSFLGAACATAPPRPEVVWPDPPETPRIRFVRHVATGTDLDNSTWADFRRFIVGEKVLSVSQPMGLAISDDGQRLYVADYGQATILRVDFVKKTMEPFAEEEARASVFNVALDDEENVYLSDPLGRRVIVFDRAGKRLRSFGEGLERPTGLAIDRRRKVLYVADTSRQDSQNHRVLAYSLEGTLMRQVGRSRGSGDGEFNFPTYLAVDDRSQLHVADTLNFRIQVFDAEGQYLQSFGQAGSGPGSFSRLKGLAFDGFGNLYAVEGEYALVQMFNRNFEVLMFFGGKAPKLEYMQMPTAVAIHRGTNRIYVAETDNPRVNVYDLINTTAADASERGATEPAPKGGPGR